MTWKGKAKKSQKKLSYYTLIDVQQQPQIQKAKAKTKQV